MSRIDLGRLFLSLIVLEKMLKNGQCEKVVKSKDGQEMAVMV